MNTVRHTIFLSSTFRDLQEERQSALNAILGLGYFPIGMEIFPAANSTPWELIQTMINDSDYYVLIIAGKYGTETSEGVSYTEREYNLAVELKKPILAFLHEDINMLVTKNVEITEVSKKKLTKFRSKVADTHLCKFWKDRNELALFITQSLLSATKINPTNGWIRNEYDVASILNDLNKIRSENEKLREDNQKLKLQIKTDKAEQNKYDGSQKITISFSIGSGRDDKTAQISTDAIFLGIAEHIMYPQDFARVLTILSSVVAREYIKMMGDIMFDERLVRISDESLHYILKYFTAHELIERKIYDLSENGRMQHITKWMLTKNGEKKYLNALFGSKTKIT